MYKKILIANRGEIALRIIRTCKNLNIKTVVIYSSLDRNSMHVFQADEAICINHTTFENGYLNINKIIDIAKIKKVDAIHPGYGFLSEDFNFAKLATLNKIDFIGPNFQTIKISGNKIKAKKLAAACDIKTLKTEKCSLNMKNNIINANKLGYPIIIKPIIGGGGKGIKFINKAENLIKNIHMAKKEAKISFNKTTLYMERYLENSRHIEIQVICDKKTIIFLGERECSIQMKYQKFIEETPIHNINTYNLKKLKIKCIKFLHKIKYINLGTLEFLYKNEEFYFLEINPRIQVEHAITESITGIDLVEHQIKTAYKKKLSIKAKAVKFSGHSIECRINIENLYETKVQFLHIPSGMGIRFDSHIYNGYKLPSTYDRLIGKLIVHEKNRIACIKKILTALNEIIIFNINTNIYLLKYILNNKDFINNNITLSFIPTKKKEEKNYIKKYKLKKNNYIL